MPHFIVAFSGWNPGAQIGLPNSGCGFSDLADMAEHAPSHVEDNPRAEQYDEQPKAEKAEAKHPQHPQFISFRKSEINVAPIFQANRGHPKGMIESFDIQVVRHVGNKFTCAEWKPGSASRHQHQPKVSEFRRLRPGERRPSCSHCHWRAVCSAPLYLQVLGLLPLPDRRVGPLAFFRLHRRGLPPLQRATRRPAAECRLPRSDEALQKPTLSRWQMPELPTERYAMRRYA